MSHRLLINGLCLLFGLLTIGGVILFLSYLVAISGWFPIGG